MNSNRSGQHRPGCQLSVEQVQRMEENRRKAQAKLAAKRAIQDSSGIKDQPPAKRPAYNVTQKGHISVPHSNSLPGPSCYGNHRPNLPPNQAPNSSSLAHSHRQQTQQAQLKPFHQSTLEPVCAQSSYRDHPSSNVELSTQSSQHPQVSYSKASTATTHSQPSSTFFKTAAMNHASTKATDHKVPNRQESKAAVPQRPPVKYTQLRDKKKARVSVVSRRRFEVSAQYDNGLIEIFKKMPTRAYNAISSVWSFGIEDYNSLVLTIQKECPHMEIEQIPKPVVNLFLSQLSKTQSSSNPQAHSSSTHLRQSHSVKVDWSRIEPKLCDTLMQFQREGVEYAIARDGRVLIADDMGLGKTLQAIAVMSYYHSDWPLLVVCPSSVRFTWAEAFKRWIPSLNEGDINVILTTKGNSSFCLVNIVSYDLLVKMSEEVIKERFGAVIADESHFLKNSRTARSKAAIPVIKNARRAVLLSGTPALSRPIELYNQITAVDRNFRYMSSYQFGVRYCNGVKGQFGWDFSGASNMAELQMYLEDAIMIRRLKSEVLDQLPSKTREMVLLDISSLKGSSKDWTSYKRQLDDASKLKTLERRNALLPLFDVTGKMKLPAVRDYILDMLEGGRKIIVFAHHLAVLDGLCEALDKKSVKYIRIDGKTPPDLRQTLCDQFQHREECLVAVLSITTANAGLTLTAASTVIFAELFWNPGILVQAEDRAYRIGQKSSVNIHYLIAKDTVDDFIWPLIQNKLSVLSQAGLAKDDFSSAESSVVTAKDASQKTLMDCFGDLVSKSELEQLTNFDDTLELETPGTSAQ